MFAIGNGYTQNLFVSENAFQKTMAGHGDGYLALIAADGSAILKATYIGGRNEERLGRIAILPSGDPVISGYTYTNDYPTTPDAVQTTMGEPELHRPTWSSPGSPRTSRS